MRRLLPVALLALCACSEDLPGEIDCTADARVSVTVEVLDEASEDIAAEVFYDAGDGEQPCEEWGDGGYACGFEVGGDLLVRAQAEGFQDASETVFVDSDACHVIGESLVLELVAEEP
ncbi:MAG: hypothetical protein ACI9VR_005315 [Cognaticolwellia sp.]|jgi:hypothetical protein